MPLDAGPRREEGDREESPYRSGPAVVPCPLASRALQYDCATHHRRMLHTQSVRRGEGRVGGGPERVAEQRCRRGAYNRRGEGQKERSDEKTPSGDCDPYPPSEE
jgi:hypothetical protein